MVELSEMRWTDLSECSSRKEWRKCISLVVIEWIYVDFVAGVRGKIVKVKEKDNVDIPFRHFLNVCILTRI